MKPSEYPQISVVVPVYNRASIMGPTLDSLAAQTARDIEIIMVDNNSTDGSYELAGMANPDQPPGAWYPRCPLPPPRGISSS